MLDLRTTYDGVARRGREIETVLRASSILVVTTTDPAPVSEAVRFYRELPGLASTPSAVIFNRALPEDWVAYDGNDTLSPQIQHIVEAWSAETLRQRDVREEFSARYGATVATVPWSSKPPTKLDGLARLIEAGQGIPWDTILPTDLVD